MNEIYFFYLKMNERPMINQYQKNTKPVPIKKKQNNNKKKQSDRKAESSIW